MRFILKRIYKLIALILIPAVLCGCGMQKDKEVIITTGFNEDEVFKMGDSVCSLDEVMVYIADLQRQYEKAYGSQIWNTNIDGVSLENNVKEVALARISQVKAVCLMAKDRGVDLSDEETKKVREAAEEYYHTFTSDEIKSLGIKKDTIEELYTEYALSKKVYDSIIKDVNPEISDDEARSITVKQIYIKTFNYDDDGGLTPYDDSHKDAARQKAEDLRKRIQNGEDFDTLAFENSDSDEINISFGKGDVDISLEVAAFDLSKDELSDVIETEYGFYIVKCISTFDREETEENKLKIVDRRKQEAFNGEYEDFVSSVTKKLNNELWESVSINRTGLSQGKGFFEIFDEHFDSL